MDADEESHTGARERGRCHYLLHLPAHVRGVTVRTAWGRGAGGSGGPHPHSWVYTTTRFVVLVGGGVLEGSVRVVVRGLLKGFPVVFAPNQRPKNRHFAPTSNPIQKRARPTASCRCVVAAGATIFIKGSSSERPYWPCKAHTHTHIRRQVQCKQSSNRTYSVYYTHAH